MIFSELSPRPHDTGLVTLLSQDLSEFDLHARAVLGLPVPRVRLHGPTASAVILAEREAERFSIQGLREALALGGDGGGVEVRLFGKPTTRKHRRMGVALAAGRSVDEARERARQAAAKVRITYED
ncbi:hypothetical protein ACFQY9_15495 [Microvirga aerilata]|uniref:hypothetical protein n=1 Tax=Microvirga aerilata TaxID=670292 RepID=UPI0036409AE1